MDPQQRGVLETAYRALENGTPSCALGASLQHTNPNFSKYLLTF